jgi:ankyrin repeat protein
MTSGPPFSVIWIARIAALSYLRGMEFVLAATSGRRARAEALLAADPEIARDPWARLTLGEGWDGDVNEPGGPRGWAPLLYVCFSVFASVDLARELLARGADPNVTFKNEYGDMPALYGAAGVIHNPELTRLLLEAGANADDGESPYHATEAPDPECLRLVLEHGGNPEPIVLAHALDYEGRDEHVKLLLAAGADPSDLLPFAVRRGRGPATLRLLVEHGAQLEARGGEDWRKPKRRRTAYQHAVLRGRADSAQALADLGAETHVDEDDLAVAAIARGETPDTVPTALDYDQQEVLILYALDAGMAHVVDLYGPDFRGVVGGSPEGSLLEHAGWVGHAAHTRFLLDRGAAKGDAFDWCVHGSRNQFPARDYVGVAKALDPVIEARHLEQADSPLAEWLQARLRP